MTTAQIMSSLLQNSNLKKVGNITWPFKYDLNQVPYGYILVMMNRFKELDLVDREPEKLWFSRIHNMVQGVATKAIPKGKKRKKAKSGKVLQITEEGREVKGKREREKYIPNWMQSSKEY